MQLRCAKTAEHSNVLFQVEAHGDPRSTVLGRGSDPPEARRRGLAAPGDPTRQTD